MEKLGILEGILFLRAIEQCEGKRKASEALCTSIDTINKYLENLEQELKSISQKKITELCVHDEKIASDKKLINLFLQCAIKNIPDVYFNIKVYPNIIDNEVINLFSRFYCSIEIPFTESKNQIAEKDKNLKGKMETQGTTPRRLTDLIGSLCDLTSGSGDKGTPVVYIQGYFDNYAND